MIGQYALKISGVLSESHDVTFLNIPKHLTDDEKVQILLDVAALINPAVQDVADTLVATINRVKGANRVSS